MPGFFSWAHQAEEIVPSEIQRRVIPAPQGLKITFRYLKFLSLQPFRRGKTEILSLLSSGGKKSLASNGNPLTKYRILIFPLLSTETQLAAQQLPSCHITLEQMAWTWDNRPTESESSTKLSSFGLKPTNKHKTLKRSSQLSSSYY